MRGDVILQRGGYEPIVLLRDGVLIYVLPVASGHVDFTVEFEIRDEDLAVLQTDDERFVFLFAALHHPHQLAPFPSDEQRDAWVKTILHAPRDEVEALLTKLDQGGANGAISSVAATVLGRDQRSMRRGVWFARS